MQGGPYNITDSGVSELMQSQLQTMLHKHWRIDVPTSDPMTTVGVINFYCEIAKLRRTIIIAKIYVCKNASFAKCDRIFENPAYNIIASGSQCILRMF